MIHTSDELTLRDMFAANLVAAMYVDPETLGEWREEHSTDGVTFQEYISRNAYMYADAMLAARRSQGEAQCLTSS